MAYDLEIGAITVYCEASNQSEYARLGVAWAIVNRFFDPAKRYGHTIAEVCLKRMQFSEWNGDQPDSANLLRAARCPQSDLIMLDCEEAMDRAIANSVPDPTRGATHFYADGIPAPSWSLSATKTTKLGSINFFKNVP